MERVYLMNPRADPLRMPTLSNSSFLPGPAHEFEMLTWQENVVLAHVLPINEGYRPGADIQGLLEDLPDLAHGLPPNLEGESMYPIEDPNLSTHLCLGWRRDAGAGSLDFLQPFAAQNPPSSWIWGMGLSAKSDSFYN